MTDTARSTRLFFGLILVVAVLAAASTFLPQGYPSGLPQTAIPLWQIALASAGSILLLYGGLGYLGLRLTRKLGYPDLLDARVTTRQRFIVPGFVGLWLGLILIVADNIFARFHNYGPLPHPPFPTSIVASLSAGIGEEVLFRLFFIPAVVWFISRVILKGAQESAVYVVATFFSASFFAAGHVPSVMLLLGVDSVEAIPMALLSEIFMLNGALSFVAAYFLRTSGYLAAATVHTSADFVWHVLWGLLR
ncbi:MAG: CPBP family glutamic-type intramembrane protease [Dehalococcoidia bacterium]|jgi:membrane protease YdiL (CAAX protease family)|nr:CPBP family glutamic-type intramembrane protease [Dehalococcoidia bacterium]